MLYDSAIYLTYFLSIATTNQLAVASATNDSQSQIKTTSHALGVAALLGSVITLTICFRGGSLIKFLLGSGGFLNGVDMTSDVVAAAISYTRIRAYAAPLVVMGIIAQSISLATLDTRTPALAVLVASLVNIVGDVLLVVFCNFGLSGAALATTAASSASSIILLVETRKKVHRWRKNSSTESRSKKMNFISFPDIKSFLSLCKLAGPIFFVMIGKLICYSATTFRANSFGMLTVAAHSIMLRIFYFLCPFGDSFSYVAQSFLPTVIYGEDSGDHEVLPVDQSLNYGDGNTNEVISSCDGEHDESKKKIVKNIIDIIKKKCVGKKKNIDPSKSSIQNKNVKILLKRILVLASAVAVIDATVSKLILQRCSSIFTNDPIIQSLISEVPINIFYFMGSVLLHPLIMTFEGVILATRDLGYLVSSYCLTIGILLSLLQFRTITFSHVWRSLLMFQLIRFFLFGVRIFCKTIGGVTIKKDNNEEISSD